MPDTEGYTHQLPGDVILEKSECAEQRIGMLPPLGLGPEVGSGREEELGTNHGSKEFRRGWKCLKSSSLRCFPECMY